ncbi:hypothetical protein FA95DRAFT_627873 [Auriscalpium vulgare]|uniref:Uncharacterized protein n=1 Tax=Auriscalpium vulgare TaxID=40419 RepID=A0ACB8RDL7_9AGAM|nr:hypothetical protein FA95DRAFT_627873 [Auriscalpium vulgare]
MTYIWHGLAWVHSVFLYFRPAPPSPLLCTTRSRPSPRKTPRRPTSAHERFSIVSPAETVSSNVTGTGRARLACCAAMPPFAIPSTRRRCPQHPARLPAHRQNPHLVPSTQLQSSRRFDILYPSLNPISAPPHPDHRKNNQRLRRALPGLRGDMCSPSRPLGHRDPIWGSDLRVGCHIWDSKCVPERTNYERDNDLIRQLPSLTAIDGLLDYYFEHCNWVHRYVNEASFATRWGRYKAGESPCRVVLATVCAMVAISLLYLPEGHELLEGLPAGRDELSVRCYNIMLTVMARDTLDSSSYTLDLVELLLVRSHYLSLTRIDSEEIWYVKGELVNIAMALGLHREPGTWGIPEALSDRRRWAWWHILFLERWSAFVFGRPLSFASKHFDTQLPSAEDSAGDSSPNPYTVNIALFRLGHLIGEFMDDATSLRPVAYGTILDMDRLLQQWLDGLHPELNVDDLSLIRSATSPATSTRRLAVQSIFLRAMFLHIRFALHRAYAGSSLRGDSPEMSTSMNIAVDAADKLISLAMHVRPDSLGSAALVVLGHMSVIPFHLFSAAMFLASLLIDNPEKVAFQSFRPTVGHAITGLNRLIGRPFVDKGLGILQALEPLYAETYVHESPADRSRKRAEAFARVQTLAFPAPNLRTNGLDGFDASAGPVDLSMSSSPSSPWEPGPIHSHDAPSTGTSSVSSLSPSLPWASVGIRNVLNPYVPRKRLRSQSDNHLSNSSYSTPSTPQTEMSSSYFVPSTSGSQSWRRASTSSHTQSYTATPPSAVHLNSFVQEESQGTYKIPSSDKESIWGASIGFEKGELGQFFDDMEDGTT